MFIITIISRVFIDWFIQHVPRINGEIPSVDEASFDHQRLIDRYSQLTLEICMAACLISRFIEQLTLFLV